MNKQIKFRAKTFSGGWVFGVPVTYLIGKTVMFFSMETTEYRIQIIPETIGQLLHTEKGLREWYEGDIAKITSEVVTGGGYSEEIHIENEYTGEVIMCPRKGLCIKKPIVYDMVADEWKTRLSENKTIVFSRSEILGNIHDKPELLKGGSNG